MLLTNHYHLLLQTPHANLSRAMQWLNVSYGVWYNRRHDRAGPLFQGRFKSVPGVRAWQRLLPFAHVIGLLWQRKGSPGRTFATGMEIPAGIWRYGWVVGTAD